VTGFLGPNGSGKSTTMRMIMGLDRPTAGHVTIDGKPYNKLASPLHEVGALLEAKAVHPGRSARSHLRALAATHGIGRRRVDEVIELTGISTVASRRVGGFSLGMGQRLGIATALLGDPRVLILDEPVNGLDPEGVHWIRTLVRGLADQGRTVFISSHLMSEMSQTADELLVIGRGRIITAGPVKQVIDSTVRPVVLVRSPNLDPLVRALPQGASVRRVEEHAVEIENVTAPQIGEAAAQAGAVLHELSPRSASLEDAFMRLTHGSVEYHAGGQAPPQTGFGPTTNGPQGAPGGPGQGYPGGQNPGGQLPGGQYAGGTGGPGPNQGPGPRQNAPYPSNHGAPNAGAPNQQGRQGPPPGRPGPVNPEEGR
jgi:ABC-2 type transport system ATP-binding protein